MADITKINLKGTELDIKDANAVPKTRTVNGKALSTDITLTASDVGALPSTTTIPAAQVQSDWNATEGMGVILNKPTIPTESTVSEWGFTKNAGTITGVTMNGASKGTSGVVDLGTVITAHQDISGKANTADLAAVAMSGNYDDLSNKPTMPAAQVNSDWNASTGKAAILNKPTIPVGIANATTSEDGTWTMTLSNGEYITIDLNHEHPQYQPLLAAGTNITIAEVSGILTISASGGNSNAITGITMNGNAVTVNNGVASLGTVITSHQSLSGYAKYVLLADEAAYTALATKDSGTLYLIPES